MPATIFIEYKGNPIAHKEIWINDQKQKVRLQDYIYIDSYSDYLIDNQDLKTDIVEFIGQFSFSGSSFWGNVSDRNVVKDYNNCVNSLTSIYQNQVDKLGLTLRIKRYKNYK